MEFVSVMNNKPSLLHFPETLTEHKTDGQPTRLQAGEGWPLAPGRNSVPKDVLAKAMKNKQVRSWFGTLTEDDGTAYKGKAPKHKGKSWLELAGSVDDPEGVPAPEDLTEHTVQQVGALVDAESNLAVLERWLDADERPQVKQVIKRRVDALKAGAAQPASTKAPARKA